VTLDPPNNPSSSSSSASASPASSNPRSGAARRLVLASASPRRQELLRDAGYEFIVHPSDIDEDDFPERILPAEIALHLARQKVRKVAKANGFANDVILAADTVVAFGDELIGKPEDVRDAKRILRLLSGTTHIVITAVALATDAATFLRTARVMSSVRMRFLSELEIERYLESGQWRGKAGAYGIQDKDPFVTRIAGCHTNIVGLPMTTTKSMLAEIGIVPAGKDEKGKYEVL
jgi:septum formation protein